MPSYITRERLQRLSAGLNEAKRARLVEQATTRSVTGSTFLSHASADIQLLPAVLSVLEEHGSSVYIDKKDPSLPPYTSKDTAEALRRRIVGCRNFVLFASTQSRDSRWIPWELGIADGVKSARQTAIFPSVDTVGDYAWAEREYLGVYERVVFGAFKGTAEEVWMVWDHRTNTGTPLREWLAR